MEIIGPVILLIIVIVVLVGLLNWNHNSSRQRNELRRAPALLLPDGEPPDVLLANARSMHSLAQRSARLLDRITNDKAITLSKADRQEADSILKTFYSR